MAGKNFAFKTKHKEIGANADTITLDNAASLTIFQLRQELTRRGVFDEIFGSDGEKRNINFEACLEVLVAELVKEKDEAEKKHAEELQAAQAPEGETLQEKLAREKEERKQAALERSRQRQASNTYFEERKQSNEEAALKKAGKEKSESQGPVGVQGGDDAGGDTSGADGTSPGANA